MSSTTPLSLVAIAVLLVAGPLAGLEASDVPSSEAREWNELTRGAIEVWPLRPGVCRLRGDVTGGL